MATHDIKEAEKSKEEASKMLGDIREAHGGLKGSVESLAHTSAGIASDIASIVTSLQFQDITRQKVAHVVEPLDEIKFEIEDYMGKSKHFINMDEAGNERLDKLVSRYTMENERNTLKIVSGEVVDSSSEVDDGQLASNVTLF